MVRRALSGKVVFTVLHPLPLSPLPLSERVSLTSTPPFFLLHIVDNAKMDRVRGRDNSAKRITQFYSSRRESSRILPLEQVAAIKAHLQSSVSEYFREDKVTDKVLHKLIAQSQVRKRTPRCLVTHTQGPGSSSVRHKEGWRQERVS